MDFDQGILYGIGSSFFRAQNLMGQSLSSCLVMTYQRVEGTFITATGGLDQFRHLHYGRAKTVAAFESPVNRVGSVIGPTTSVVLGCFRVVHGYLPYSE